MAAGSNSACPLRIRTLVGLAAAVAALLALAGCSGSGSGTSNARSASQRAASTSAPAGSGASAPSGAPSSGGTSSSAPVSSGASGGASSRGSTSQGGIYQTVPARTITTAPPVPLRSPADFGGRVSAHITSIKAINATAQGTGELSGPALAVSFTIVNGSAKALSLDSVTANLTDSSGAPAVSMIGSPAHPFRGVLAAGRSGSGVYVFSVPTTRRSPVTISLSYTTSAPVVLFVGSAA